MMLARMEVPMIAAMIHRNVLLPVESDVSCICLIPAQVLMNDDTLSEYSWEKGKYIVPHRGITW